MTDVSMSIIVGILFNMYTSYRTCIYTYFAATAFIYIKTITSVTAFENSLCGTYFSTSSTRYTILVNINDAAHNLNFNGF